MFYSHESPANPSFLQRTLTSLTRLQFLHHAKMEWLQSGEHLTSTLGTNQNHSRPRLVATLGSRSNLKKVNRKAILDVDVPKTCGVIINPEAPMALRLQSNLL